MNIHNDNCEQSTSLKRAFNDNRLEHIISDTQFILQLTNHKIKSRIKKYKDCECWNENLKLDETDSKMLKIHYNLIKHEFGGMRQNQEVIMRNTALNGLRMMVSKIKELEFGKRIFSDACYKKIIGEIHRENKEKINKRRHFGLEFMPVLLNGGEIKVLEQKHRDIFQKEPPLNPLKTSLFHFIHDLSALEARTKRRAIELGLFKQKSNKIEEICWSEALKAMSKTPEISDEVATLLSMIIKKRNILIGGSGTFFIGYHFAKKHVFPCPEEINPYLNFLKLLAIEIEYAIKKAEADGNVWLSPG